MSTSPADPITDLLWLSHEIGRESRGLVILSEGNTSTKTAPDRFVVKSSGAVLGTLTREELTECSLEKVTAMLDLSSLDAVDLERFLMAARIDPQARRPSLESTFHAWLLQLDGVNFVAHCHPEACCQILCSPAGERFADQRMFPDEVVYCGPQSIFVPYADPGINLSREIRGKVLLYLRRNYGRIPRLILLQNHGVIALGSTAQGVLTALMMAEKSARIFTGAARLGGPIFLPPQQVNRLDVRPDDTPRGRQGRA